LPDLSQRLTTALADRYRIERTLGRGGMATVFLAEDLKHHRRVAIKVLDPEVAAAIGPERFQREIETVAKLSHPHVLTLHDSGQAGGLLFFVMPYVRGESLRQRLERDRQLPLEDALQITREVADALDHAHRQGVVHRDIKPENILLEEGHALVADFGIARAVAAAGGEKLTATGVVVGTPAYMSPEQAGGSSRLDGRSDQYSLGCVLYEMLAGQPPFTGPTVESLVHQHLSVAPHPVTAVRSSVPLAVERALARALAKTPADRYATPCEFVVALTAEVEPEPQPRTRVGRRWALPTATVLVALLAVAAWQAWWPFGGSGGPAPAKKDWILVAEFDGPPGDSMLAPAARSLLSAALDQSKIVATVQQDQITEALQNAGKPPGIRLTPIVAKELAYRSSVRTVLEGTIGKLGSGYSVVVRLVDVDTARVLFTQSATAKGDDALIPVMGELAKELRRGLGENRRSLAATRPMEQVATPSFEAYKLYVQAGLRFGANTGIRERIRAYRAALRIDPDFASAYLGMVYPYLYMVMPDSAQMCLDAALRHPERLTPVERDLAEMAVVSVEGDCEGALAIRDRILAFDPGNLPAMHNSFQDLGALGRYEEALDQVHRAMKLSPFGPTEGMRLIETGCNLCLGRVDEARAANERMTGVHKIGWRIDIEDTALRFAVAESIATANLAHPNPDVPSWYPLSLSFARFGRGAIRDATEIRSRMSGTVAPDSVVRLLNFASSTEQSVITDGLVPLPPDTWARDTTAGAILYRGLAAAARRDQAAARRCLDALHRRSKGELAFLLVGVPLLEARVAAMAGRPEEAVRLLRPYDRWRWQRQSVALTWAHWWLADAFEQTGRPDSAAWYLERLEHPLTGPDDGAYSGFVHRRLALLDVKLGRIADAERNLAAAEQAWDQPDPAVRRMLDEARSAVRAARALSPPRR
jgi:tRNA A-37 threonylcarbamoyl transferase component Bud32/tetratricopeptide (TPR) repeat protein